MTVACDDEPIRGVAGPLSDAARIVMLEERVFELEALVVSLIDQLRSVASWQAASMCPPGAVFN
jgi:hypothetical protein